jgi:hypothetical protein
MRRQLVSLIQQLESPVLLHCPVSQDLPRAQSKRPRKSS